MDPALRKDAADAPLLGPPRNAMLWMRAKQMAQAMGKMGDFQTILQVYQMLTLAPGFAAVSKSALRCDGVDWRALDDVSAACGACLEKGRTVDALQQEAALWAQEIWRQMVASTNPTPDLSVRKSNMGRKQPNGRRQGLWKWAKEKARRKGKPESYAAGIARRVMGKSVAPLTAGLRLNASPHWDRMLQVATANISNPESRPSRPVAAISDVVSGLPLGPDAMAQLVIDLAEVVEQAQSPADAMRQAGVATQEHPELHGPLAQEVASRVAFLHGMFAA